MTRLSINSALSASASQNSDLESMQPHRTRFISVVFSVELICGNVLCLDV